MHKVLTAGRLFDMQLPGKALWKVDAPGSKGLGAR